MIHYPGSIGSVSDHPGAIRGRSAGDRGLAETSDGREMSRYADSVAGGYTASCVLGEGPEGN